MSRFLSIPLSLPRLIEFGRPRTRRRGLLFAALAVAAAIGVTIVASRMWWSASASPRRDSKVVPALGADLGTPRARAVATARALRANRTAKRDASSLLEERTADVSHVAALFASHSWYVAPPPPPPVAPPPPAPPEAPPFPYTFVGSYTPAGDSPVYFLSRADRVIDAHVGDRLDGVYAFESAESGSLVFNYLPLNIRQSVPIGVSP
jgi:hypothetical protein